MRRILLLTLSICLLIFACSKEDSKPKQVSLDLISLNETDIDLKIGSSFQFKPTFTPENAFDKEIIWSSSNTGIVSVSATGLITAHEIGEATIIARNQKSNKSATSLVKISPISITEINLNKNILELQIGSFETLTAVISPNNATNKKLLWVSEDSTIATVDESGRVDGVGVGTTFIIVKSADGKLSAKVEVNILHIPISALILNKNALTLDVDAFETLVVTYEPSNATDLKLIWDSEDTKIATVDQKGMIKAISTGTVNISVKTENGNLSQVVKVKVNPISTTGIAFNKATLTLLVNDTKTIVPIIHPENAANKNVTWKSSDPNIVSVDGYGSIIAHKIGTAIITATTVDGNFATTCKVNIVSPGDVVQVVAKAVSISTDVPGRVGVNIPIVVGVYNPTSVPIKVKRINILINEVLVLSQLITSPLYTKTYYYYEFGPFFFPYPINTSTLLNNWIIHTEYEMNGIAYNAANRIPASFGYPLTWNDFDQSIYSTGMSSKSKVQGLNLKAAKPIEIKTRN